MDNINRIYWSIGDAASEFEIPKSTLRFWEDEFDWIKINKNKKGNRQYTESSLQQLIDIHILSRNGMTLDGIKMAHEYDYFQETIEFFKIKEIKRRNYVKEIME